MATLLVLVRDTDKEPTACELYGGEGVTDVHFFKNAPDAGWSRFAERYAPRSASHGVINQFDLFD